MTKWLSTWALAAGLVACVGATKQSPNQNFRPSQPILPETMQVSATSPEEVEAVALPAEESVGVEEATLALEEPAVALDDEPETLASVQGESGADPAPKDTAANPQSAKPDEPAAPREPDSLPSEDTQADAELAAAAQQAADEALAAEALAAAEEGLEAENSAGDETSSERAQADEPKSRLRIGVFYSSTPTGQRHWKGAFGAVRDHKELEPFIQLVPRTYLTEREGEQLLLEAIRAEEFDLVLGPTDSGVFVRAAKQETNLGDKNIPVISSLVAADAANEESGWFFRTNASVVRRSSTMYDFLDRNWIKSIAVVYADTELGRAAEGAFAPHLRGIQRDMYQALPFVPPNVRTVARRILETRPEAVGIFGGREDVVATYAELRSMNTGVTPYRPVLFTLIDIRKVAADVDDFHFVSVVRPARTEGDEVAAIVDDVEALSYDTTSFVLDAVHRILLREGQVEVAAYDKERLRDRFVNLLSGAVDTPGTKSAMRFANMENSAKLRVYKISTEDEVAPNEDGTGILATSKRVELLPSEHVPWQSKLALKWQLMRNRFGLWPLGSILVILLTVVFTAIHDLYRWYGGRLRRLLFFRGRISPHFLALVLLQAVVAIGLFVFLGETGRVRYDSWINGFVIALAPSPILRANLVRIGGKNIGFADSYDRVLQSLTRKLLIGRYKHRENSLLILAYYNSLKHLKSTLYGVYRSLPNREEADRLRAKLDTDLEAEPLHIERRKICAERLMELRPWDELAKLGCVPPRTLDASENVEHTIHDAVRHCMTNDLAKEVRALVQQQLSRSPDKARKHYETKLAEAEDERDQLYVDFQFLVMRFGLMNADFVKRGWVTPSEEADEPSGEDVVQPKGPRQASKGKPSAKATPRRKARTKT